jgi:uncharacterized protein YbjT (DUF2867 family)
MATTTTLIRPFEARQSFFATNLAYRYFSIPDIREAPASSEERQDTAGANIFVPPLPSESTSALPVSYRDNAPVLNRSGLSKETSDRIFQLAAKSSGHNEEQARPLDAASLRAFLSFWISISAQAREPILSLAPNGNLVAHWHASWRRHLDLEFDRGNIIYFGLFDNHDVVQGKAVSANLIQTLAGRTNNPFMWKQP